MQAGGSCSVLDQNRFRRRSSARAAATLHRPRLSLYPQIVVLPQFHRAQGNHLDGMSHTHGENHDEEFVAAVLRD